ncbi:VWA domain-containing protein [Stieleria sp. TO1_6]|uniref:VWA domain-containing protein n=1 Tax=Stieleria tagensis TaxID=2956795 RepID=UPI00209B2DE8|nr:VWA domain-containing protein [Stieleria tagensis]MCO8123950.1 VWA domain-containing protein [Stieleria tagensis]
MPSRQSTAKRLLPPYGNRLMLVLWMALIGVTSGSLSASDRDEIRFRKLLQGRHDNGRMIAMRAIGTDFQSRSAALPVVIESLTALVDDPRFARAEKQGQPVLPDGVRLMIEFVGTIDRPDATDALVRLLNCPFDSWSMAAVQTLCKNQHHTALDDVIALVDSDYFDRNYGFRFALARGLIEMKHPDAWEALAKLYDRVEGQLAHRLHQQFEKVTAEDFKDDADRFQAWRGRVGLSIAEQDADPSEVVQASATDPPLPQRMGLAPSQSAASYLRERHLKPSKYYGIDIYAKRLLFVIDRSGSMKTPVGNQSRFEHAKQELGTAIMGLDESCEFSILVFDSDVRPWRPTLVQATEENKRNALRFIDYLSAGSSTNTYAALRQSLDFDEQLEAVFMLTDGKPTSGQLVHPSAILIDILRRNESHNITLNTIAIGVDPLMQGFLRKLTEPSEGEYREVN